MESLIDLQHLTGEYLWDLGVNIIVALVILVVGRLAANAISGLTRRLLQRSGLEEILINFATTITNALFTLVVIIAAVDRLGVDTTSLIALLGAAGIAVGLALKDSLGNFAAGIMLIVSCPFRTGDYVEVAGSAGSVEKISLFNYDITDPGQPGNYRAQRRHLRRHYYQLVSSRHPSNRPRNWNQLRGQPGHR